MADDATTDATTPQNETAATETPTAPEAQVSSAAGLVTYIVQHRLLHDNHEYAKGDLFQHADAGIIATLRNAKAIALQTEVQSADAVAQQIAALEAQLARARAENEQLMAARERRVVQPTPASGKAAK